jgi:hypothetical protein
MRVPKRIIPKGTQTFDTELELPITVEYSIVGAEPDVGEAGGIEIECVYIGKMGISLTEDQLDSLAGEIEESHISAFEAACDNAYDEMREERS